MSQPAFVHYPVVDVSTKYVTAADGRLLLEGEATPIIGTINEGRGALLFLGMHEDEASLGELRAAGWSDAFCALVAAVSAAGFEYLRLDADGADIEGGDLPTFHW